MLRAVHRNAPGDGSALPRHPDHFVDIPFREQLCGDLMIGLFGELPLRVKGFDSESPDSVRAPPYIVRCASWLEDIRQVIAAAIDAVNSACHRPGFAEGRSFPWASLRRLRRYATPSATTRATPSSAEILSASISASSLIGGLAVG